MTDYPLLNSFLFLLVVGIALGILHFLIDKAPFINDMFKTILKWIIYVVGAVILIDFLFGLVGYSFIHLHP